MARKAAGRGGLLIHGGVHLLVALGMGLGNWSVAYGLLALLLAGLHVVIDWAKVQTDRLQPRGYWPVATFLVDQGLHLIAIVILSSMFGFISTRSLVQWLAASWVNTQYTYLASIYVACLFGGSILVRLTTRVFQVPTSDVRGVEGAGAYIGVIERLAITTLVALGQHAAVGFVLAAKSIARYKKIEEEKGFGEYYLIGTLTSSTIAILAGLAVKWMLGSILP